MSDNERAREFLDVWEAENIEHVAQSEKSREAQRLAPLCQADAIRAGISDRSAVGIHTPLERTLGWRRGRPRRRSGSF